VRIALLSAFVVGASVFACSTFGGSDGPEPTPAIDAGPEVAPDPGGCKPVVFDPSAPSFCPGKDLTSDPQHCGACGHQCVDTKCIEGRCEVTKLTDELPPFGVVGTNLYHQVGSDLHVRDLTSADPVSKVFLPTLSGTVKYIEAYEGVLYIGSTNDQTTLRVADKTPAKNTDFAAVGTTVTDGHFFPGPTSYYLYDDPAGGQVLARIAAGKVDVKRKPKFTPIAQSGGDIFWTETLSAGANVFGPWESDSDPVARVQSLEAFAVEGETVFIATAGNVSRVTRNGPAVPLATEPGVGIAIAIEGENLWYAVRREAGGLAPRFHLYRVDKCRGGEPVHVFEEGATIKRFFFIDSTHVMIDTSNGLFRTRR
jgi:hypothetical protein